MDLSTERALAAYGFEPPAAASPLPGGLINQTFLVRDQRGARVGILQRLHPIFAPQVNVDIDRVTSFLADAGVMTPRLRYTTGGAHWVMIDNRCWRMLTFVVGTTFHKVEEVAQVESAGALVGSFHRVLDQLEYDFVFTRAGVHDTHGHLARLRSAMEDASASGPIFDASRELAREILTASDTLPDLDGLPKRICHGDLKLSNILFSDDNPTEARCLVDLDTLGRQTMAYELGDALRSWCNPHGEDVIAPEFELDIFRGALSGYAAGAANLLTQAEVASLVPGVIVVCIELAARFCVDVFADSYFGWNPAKFASRREHNLLRARGQLGLARSVASKAASADHIVAEIWKRPVAAR